MTRDEDLLTRFRLADVAPSSGTSEAIRDAVRHDLGPSRGASALQRLALSAAFSALVVLGFFVLARGGAHAEGALVAAVAWGVVQVAVLVVGLVQPPGRRIGRVGRVGIVALVATAFFAYLALACGRVLPMTDFFGTASHCHTAFGCAARGLMWGGLTGAGVLLLWRRTDPLSPGVSGAVAGLAGGLAGAVAIGLACPNVELWHLWIGHGLVVVGLVVVGWLAGRRSFAP